MDVDSITTGAESANMAEEPESGIAAGFHMAYTAADTNGPAERKSPGFPQRPSERKDKTKKPRKNGKELHRKIHKQEGESFSEFRCHETSQDHGEAVAKAMGSQDDSYCYIANNAQK